MIEIAPCRDRLDELVQFVARLNSDATHHVGYFGDGEADVRSSLEECIIPPADGFRLAYMDDQLVGAFGVDADPEVDRAWLLGPLVESADWHEVADQLYENVLPLISADIHEYELFCDIQNTHMEMFAGRHGFPLHSENAIMKLARADFRHASNGQTQIIPYQENFFDSLDVLHKALFPNTYFTTQQMIDRIDKHRQLFLAVDGSSLLGYHFCKIEPEAESGYVDFIGTDASARGRGIGADLLTAGVDWMLSAPTTQKINLTVNADNVPARKLYESFGFVVDRIMRGYRKRLF